MNAEVKAECFLPNRLKSLQCAPSPLALSAFNFTTPHPAAVQWIASNLQKPHRLPRQLHPPFELNILLDRPIRLPRRDSHALLLCRLAKLEV